MHIDGLKWERTKKLEKATLFIYLFGLYVTKIEKKWFKLKFITTTSRKERKSGLKRMKNKQNSN